jgi:hypothetical protein
MEKIGNSASVNSIISGQLLESLNWKKTALKMISNLYNENNR